MITKLNDLLFVSKDRYKMYLYFENESFLKESIKYYKQYKLQGGKRIFESLTKII